MLVMPDQIRDFFSNIDPDLNYFNSYFDSVNCDKQSSYYTADKMSNLDVNDKLFITNSNIRSFSRNIEDFTYLMQSFKLLVSFDYDIY